MYSIFSVKCGQDAPTAWLQQHKLFALACRSTWFAFALERGAKEKHLHVQGTMTCRCYATDAGCTTMRNLLKSYLNVGQADEAKVTVKACAPGQTPTYMLGYIQKDKAKTHYEVRSTLLLPLLLRCFLHHAVASCWCMQSLQHWLPVLQIVHSDIPEGVLLNAHEAYQQIRVNYTENRTIITKGNYYKLIWQFKQRHLLPLDPHPERILFWMMQTGEYMPDPKFSMSAGFGIPVQHSRAMMYVISNPEKISMQNVYDVFHYVHGRSWQQFFIADDPYDYGFEEAQETAAHFRQNGGFVPVQNDLLGDEDWHDPVVTGRFVGDRIINIGATGGTAAALQRAAARHVSPSTLADAVAAAVAAASTAAIPTAPTPTAQLPPAMPACSTAQPPMLPATEVQAPAEQAVAGSEPSNPDPPCSPSISSDEHTSDCDPAELEAARKLSYLPVVEEALDGLAKNIENYFYDAAFLRYPVGARFQNWKRTYLQDRTVTVAEMCVEQGVSSTMYSANTLLEARSFHAAMRDAMW